MKKFILLEIMAHVKRYGIFPKQQLTLLETVERMKIIHITKKHSIPTFVEVKLTDKFLRYLDLYNKITSSGCLRRWYRLILLNRLDSIDWRALQEACKSIELLSDRLKGNGSSANPESQAA